MVIEPALLAQIISIFLVAGTVKGVLGFGLPIITMSLLPFVVPVETAIVLSAIVQPATNILQFATSGLYKRALKLSVPVMIALVPGVLIGALFLTKLNSATLLLIVGMTIALFAVNELIGKGIQISIRYRVPSGLGFGLLAGVVGALTSLNGWAFIMYLVGIGTNRQEFRSTIALLFLVSGTLISTSFFVVGLLDLHLFGLGLLAVLPSFVGMWLGDRYGKSLPADVFRKMLLMALVAIGIFIIARGLALIF